MISTITPNYWSKVNETLHLYAMPSRYGDKDMLCHRTVSDNHHHIAGAVPGGEEE